MIVALTGGSGFIGAQLLKRLLGEGHRVRVLTRTPKKFQNSSSLTLFQADLTDPSAPLGPFVDGVQVLFHCAGEIQNEARMEALHLEGTQRLLEAASQRIQHWVHLSSVGAYGPQKEGMVTEDTPLSPVGPYEITKAFSDQMVRAKAPALGFSYSILRPSNVYGPTMRNRSLFQLISLINRGRFFFVGPPGAMANYIHVQNVVEALCCLAFNAKARNQTYNLSQSLTVEELVAFLAKKLGHPPPRLRLPLTPVRFLTKILQNRKGFPLTPSRLDALTRRVGYSCEKIGDLGYETPVTLEQGLTEMVDAWESQ